MENVQGASDRGDDRFRVAIREGNGLPHRRTFRLTQVPRVHQRYDGATEWSVYRRGQLAVSDFGGGGCHAPRSKRSTSRKKGWGGGRSIVHVLRSGSGRLGRGFEGQLRVYAGTRPMPPRRVGTHPLHVGASGPHRARACRPEVLRREPLRVGVGKPTPPILRSLLEGCQ